jgi:hypothetical protein
MLSLSRLPANDNAFLPQAEWPEWTRGTNLYRPIAAPEAMQTAVRAELLRQPEVARKGGAHEIKRAIRAATTGLQWSWVGQWFSPDSEGRAIVHAMLDTLD